MKSVDGNLPLLLTVVYMLLETSWRILATTVKLSDPTDLPPPLAGEVQLSVWWRYAAFKARWRWSCGCSRHFQFPVSLRTSPASSSTASTGMTRRRSWLRHLKRLCFSWVFAGIVQSAVLAVRPWQLKLVKTVQQHSNVWMRRTVTIFCWMLTIACCLVVELGLGLDLVSGCD